MEVRQSNASGDRNQKSAGCVCVEWEAQVTFFFFYINKMEASLMECFHTTCGRTFFKSSLIRKLIVLQQQARVCWPGGPAEIQ